MCVYVCLRGYQWSFISTILISKRFRFKSNAHTNMLFDDWTFTMENRLCTSNILIWYLYLSLSLSCSLAHRYVSVRNTSMPGTATNDEYLIQNWLHFPIYVHNACRRLDIHHEFRYSWWWRCRWCGGLETNQTMKRRIYVLCGLICVRKGSCD